jgi:hypothetical protein
MLEPDAVGERTQARVPLTALMDALRAQWADMEDEERAFLVYCLRRLHPHLDASVPRQRVARAS